MTTARLMAIVALTAFRRLLCGLGVPLSAQVAQPRGTAAESTIP